MSDFIETTYLSLILENSDAESVIVFKYSNQCGTSTRLKSEIEENMKSKTITHPVYLVTVQIQKSLSKQLEEYFQIKHESPQILIVNKGKVVYKANHSAINIKDFKYE